MKSNITRLPVAALIVACSMAGILKADEPRGDQSHLTVLYSRTDSADDETRVEVKSFGLPGTSPDGRRLSVTLVSATGETLSWNAELDGQVGGAWVTDLNGDGSINVVVNITSFGTGAYGSLLVLYIHDDALIAIPLEHGGTELRDNYMGHDHFFVSGNAIIRAYPLYVNTDANCCPHGGAQAEMYRLEGTNLVMTAAHDLPRSAEWRGTVRSRIVAQFEAEQ